MPHLDPIEIHTTEVGFPLDSMYNAVALLSKVSRALRRLVNSGDSSTINLSSDLLGTVDLNHLFETLGRGEVAVTIDTLGPIHIWETAYRRVWLIEHCSPQGGVSARYIEIARLPSLLDTPEVDAGCRTCSGGPAERMKTGLTRFGNFTNSPRLEEYS